jgi:NTE family protein
MFARLAPVTEPNASQMRAQKINAAAKDGSLTTLRTIGRAALASDNRLNGPAVERVAALLTGDSRTSWPSSKMHTTAVDCYTGDRIIVSQASALRNNISLANGAAASSSLPGLIGPTLLGQRFCMDGGMCSNPAHVDVVAGSKRAVIVTLNDGLAPPLLTGIPHPLAENIRQIEAVGTKTLWIKANRRMSICSIPSRLVPHCGPDTSARRRKRVESKRSGPSVPIPKFASLCCTLVCELRNRRTLATY